MIYRDNIMQWRLLLTGLLILSLLIKLLMVVFSQEINPDAVRYINAARLFSQGQFAAGTVAGGDTFLLPWLIYLLHWIIPDWILSAQIISAVAMSLSVVPFFLITRKLFGERAAIWVGIALVLSPVLNEYSIEIIRDPLFLLFFGLALWAMLQVLDFRRTVFVISGVVFMSIAFLFRIEAIVMMVFSVMALSFYTFKDGISISDYLKSFAIYFFSPLILFMLLVNVTGTEVLSAVRLDEVLNSIYEALRFDIFTTYHQIYEQLKTFGATLPNAKWSHSFGETALHFMPLIYVIGLLNAFISVCYPLFFILILIGLITSKVTDRKHVFCLCLAVAYLVAAYFFLLKNNFISERYLLAPAMLLLPWLGAGMEKLFEMSRRKFIFLPMLVSLLLVVPMGETAKKFSRQEATIAQAGDWIKEAVAGSGQRLSFNDDRVALYAGLWYGEYDMFYDQDLKDAEPLLQGGDVEWFVYRTTPKKRATMPRTGQFDLVKEFKGERQIVLIYRRV